MESQHLDPRINPMQVIKIIRLIAKNRGSLLYLGEIYQGEARKEILQNIIENFPFKGVVAKEDLEGNLHFDSKTLNTIISIYEEDDLESAVKARIESLELEVIIIKRSQHKLDLTRILKY
jgi:hypothetical protein